MIEILKFIFIGLITWCWLHFYFYDPKSQIKRLWEQVFKYALEIGRWNQRQTQNEFLPESLIISTTSQLEAKKDQLGKLINATLDYYYSDSEDESDIEFRQENRYDLK